MNGLVLHPSAEAYLQRITSNTPHALLITAPAGSGKHAYANALAAKLLAVEPALLITHPYVRSVASEPQKSIAIEQIRELEHFLKLRVPGQEQVTSRVVMILGADSLTTEAQNALLKTLEEPPAGTVILMTATSDMSLLPTIRSRVQHVQLLSPPTELLQKHFEALGKSRVEVKRILAISAGLPGLATAMLTDQDHPIVPAVTMARQVLEASSFERLQLADQLSKQKQLATDTLEILQHMASIQLAQVSAADAVRWQKVLRASYGAAEALSVSAQPKLVLLNLMVQLA